MNEKFDKNAKVQQLTKVVLSHGEEKGLIVKDPCAKIHVQTITLTCKLNLDDITIVVHDIRVSWPWQVVIYWGQGHMHIKLKVVFGPLPLTLELDLDYLIIIIQTIIV